MPIYEYQCTNERCRRLYDQLEPSTAPREQSCIDCGGLARRVMSTPAKGNMGGESYSSGNESYSQCPCGKNHPHADIIVGIAMPIPESVAKKLIDADKKRKAAKNN